MRRGQIFCVWVIALVVFQVGTESTEDIKVSPDIKIRRVRTKRQISNAVSSFNCKNKPKISRFPDPIDCIKFIYCVAGYPYPGLCRSGKYFNPRTGRCDEPRNVPCGSRPAIPAQTMQAVVPVRPSIAQILQQPQPQALDIATASTKIPSTTFQRRSTVHLSQDSVTKSMGLLIDKNIEEFQTILDEIEDQSLTSTTTIPPTTTTQKPPRLQDQFEFELDCKSKHPCGLYPNTNGDCTTFYECANGHQITKHCNGGQLFDVRSLECQEPSQAQCWQQPDSGPLLRSTDPWICSFHNKYPANSYQNISDGSILTNPIVTNWGSWQPWVICPQGAYATGINVWRRLLQSGTNNDQAGVVSISLSCQSPDGSPRGFLESFAPGAPNDGWPKYYTCQGAGIGFRMNSQKYQGPWPNDNLAADNVQLICSCGPPVYKPYELIPGAQNGNRGDWTEEQICRPRQAICGMQTQMVEYREGVIGSFDNRGLTNMHMKCCDVPSPAKTCKPIENVLLVRTCENTNGIYPRRCDFESSVGISYDFRAPLQTQSINFYESIGFSIDDDSVTEELRQNFETNFNQDNGYEYTWDEPEEIIWQIGNSTTESLYLKPDSKVDLYQIIGSCGPYLVKTNRFYRNVLNVSTGERVKDYFEVQIF